MPSVAVPFRLAVGESILDFISTTTVFGTPVDVTLSELAIESFFPASRATAAALQRLAGSGRAERSPGNVSRPSKSDRAPWERSQAGQRYRDPSPAGRYL